MSHTKRISWSLLDQGLVSGGNFLTVVSCAHLLPLAEQGKLGYVLAGYMAVIILNMSAIFQWASVEAPRHSNKKTYVSGLALSQIILAIAFGLATAISIGFAIESTGENFGFHEIFLYTAFLFLQQLADFDRRVAYILSGPARATKSSALVYVPRIVLLLVLKPTDISNVLFLLLVAAIIPSLVTMWHALQGSQGGITAIFARIKTRFYDTRWLLISAPLAWVCSSVPVFALGWIGNLGAVGAFVSIRSLANMSNVALELLETQMSATAGKLYITDRNSFYNLIKNIRKFGLFIWGAGLVIVFTFGSAILKISFGNNYTQYKMMLVILWLANGLVFLFRLHAVELRTAEMSHVVTQGYLMSAIVMISAAYPIIHNYGVIGCASMVLLGALTNYATQAISIQKKQRKDEIWT